MCRNHSHITAVHTGTVLIGPNTLVEVRMEQPLEVQSESGERWIRPVGLHLYLPYSTRARLPLSAPRLMEVCYIPSFYTAGEDMTIMQERQRRLKTAGASGQTTWHDMDTYPTRSDDDGEYYDSVPW